MEAVVHARRQPQRHVRSVQVAVHQLLIAQQVHQRVGKSLGLQHRSAGDRAHGANDSVARAHQYGGVGVDAARTVLELAREAFMQAPEAGAARFAQVELAEQPPQRQAQLAHQRLLDAAQPAGEQRQPAARQAVGEQEVQVFLLRDLGDYLAWRHRTVTKAP